MSDSEQPEFRLCKECSRRFREMRPLEALDEGLRVLHAMSALNTVVEDFTRDIRTLNDRYIERMRNILDSVKKTTSFEA